MSSAAAEESNEAENILSLCWDSGTLSAVSFDLSSLEVQVKL